jgi:hypothetical protein
VRVTTKRFVVVEELKDLARERGTRGQIGGTRGSGYDIAIRCAW